LGLIEVSCGLRKKVGEKGHSNQGDPNVGNCFVSKSKGG